MGGSKLYFGGVPPDFPYNKFPNMVTRALLGNMRGITTSNPGIIRGITTYNAGIVRGITTSNLGIIRGINYHI